jgi:16S rRNA (guanine527-N7)-methyltransferase
MNPEVSRETPPSPESAAGVFGSRLRAAEQYAALLADAGTVRGLIGPREVPRLWERHLLNCALVGDLIEPRATVCDIGSGAGLPGLVIAIRRPDLQVTLVEPLLRRTTFLEEAVTALGLENVEVVRGRAEALHGRAQFDVVTSRAVAPLATLAQWSLPLVRRGGEMLAMKGAGAAEELAAAADVLQTLGALRPEVVHISANAVSFPTTVVRAEAGPSRQLGWGVPTAGAKKGGGRERKKRR